MLSRTTTAAAGRVVRFGSVLPGRNVYRATSTRPLRPITYSTLGVVKEKNTADLISAEIPITENKKVDSKDTETISPASSIQGSKTIPRPWLPEFLRTGHPSFKNPNIIKDEQISIERLAEIWPGLRYFLIPRDARNKSVDSLSGILKTWFQSKELRKITTEKPMSEEEVLKLVNSTKFQDTVKWQLRSFLNDCAETLARTVVTMGGNGRSIKGSFNSRGRLPRSKELSPEALVETLGDLLNKDKAKYFVRLDEKSLHYLRSLVNHIPSRDIVEHLHESLGLDPDFESYNTRVRKMISQGRQSAYEQWQEIQQSVSQSLSSSTKSVASSSSSSGVLVSYKSRFNRQRLTFQAKESGKGSPLVAYITKQLLCRDDILHYIDRMRKRNNGTAYDITQADINVAIIQVMKKQGKLFPVTLDADEMKHPERFVNTLEKEIEDLKWVRNVMVKNKSGMEWLVAGGKRVQDALKALGLKIVEKNDGVKQQSVESGELRNKSASPVSSAQPTRQKQSASQETTLRKSPNAKSSSFKSSSSSSPPQEKSTQTTTNKPSTTYTPPSRHSASSSRLNDSHDSYNTYNENTSHQWSPPPKLEDLSPEMNWPECEFIPRVPDVILDPLDPSSSSFSAATGIPSPSSSSSSLSSGAPSVLPSVSPAESTESTESTGLTGDPTTPTTTSAPAAPTLLAPTDEGTEQDYGRLTDVMAKVKTVMEQAEDGDWRKPKTEGILVPGKPWQRGLCGL
ncbi:hypothetical protein BZA77DRAFT_357281 [Pyronema omphalodes]|nr:hypothetical protein BZA77DRAFT_357281 [Pyronema omphalodes]